MINNGTKPVPHVMHQKKNIYILKKKKIIRPGFTDDINFVYNKRTASDGLVYK